MMAPTYIVGAIAIFIILVIQQSEAVEKKKKNYREKEKQILDRILGQDTYDIRIRPSGINGSDGPTIVFINLMFRDISEINDKEMEYTTMLTFREEWYDDRLRFDGLNGSIKYLTLNDQSKIWLADLFFANERRGHFHKMIIPNVYLRIYPDGWVLYSIRVSLTLSCPMNLKLFPMDQQKCSLEMRTYGWTTQDLVFKWKEVDRNGLDVRANETVQVVKKLQLPRFELLRYTTLDCMSNTTTGEYSCLRVDLIFQRKLSYYIVTIYIPCCMLVIVSWVSFWLDANAIPARVALGVTTLLTMATQTTGINNSLPPVSYTKAIDVWTGVCLTFVFSALLEFALVNYATRSDAHLEKTKKAMQAQWERDKKAALEQMAAHGVLDERNSFAMKPLVAGPGEMILIENDMHQWSNGIGSDRTFCQSTTWIGSYTLRSKRIDVICRVLFPMIFAIFNVAYWSTYISTNGEIADLSDENA